MRVDHDLANDSEPTNHNIIDVTDAIHHRLNHQKNSNDCWY